MIDKVEAIAIQRDENKDDQSFLCILERYLAENAESLCQYDMSDIMMLFLEHLKSKFGQEIKESISRLVYSILDDGGRL